MQYYLCGQTDFGNRGCEALIRTTTQIVRELDPSATFLCPSKNPILDSKQWPSAPANGIRFVPVEPIPRPLVWWGRFERRLPKGWGTVWHPDPPVSPQTQQFLEECDALIVTGGDVLSLDYGLVSLLHWVSVIRAAMRLKKPVHIWASSLGPFSKIPAIEREMIELFKSVKSISVRESASLEYLSARGVQGVSLVADPAFVLRPQEFSLDGLFSRKVERTLGFNVSPIVRGVRATEASKQQFDQEIVKFLREVISSGTNVMLVPHVDPLQGTSENSDRRYMRDIASAVGVLGESIAILPDGLNTAQLKYALGQCDYFIGARTHATIAAISQSVPTVSIAYSVKALGINEDLFGDTRYVLPTPEVSLTTLAHAFELIKADAVRIKDLLAERLPAWKIKSAQAGNVVYNMPLDA